MQVQVEKVVAVTVVMWDDDDVKTAVHSRIFTVRLHTTMWHEMDLHAWSVYILQVCRGVAA